jgi:mannose-6-phosphate isomerase-like protein (cupin superfamily)
MLSSGHVPRTAGVLFEDGEDHGRALVFGKDTVGHYGLMEYVVAARPPASLGEPMAFAPHRHGEIEETFFVLSGALQFLLGETVTALEPGDFVRAAGTRHGFANVSGAPVELLVSFTSGGFETLFVRHQTDKDPPPDPDGLVEEATCLFASEFEDGA